MKGGRLPCARPGLRVQAERAQVYSGDVGRRHMYAHIDGDDNVEAVEAADKRNWDLYCKLVEAHPRLAVRQVYTAEVFPPRYVHNSKDGNKRKWDDSSVKCGSMPKRVKGAGGAVFAPTTAADGSRARKERPMSGYKGYNEDATDTMTSKQIFTLFKRLPPPPKGGKAQIDRAIQLHHVALNLLSKVTPLEDHMLTLRCS